MSKIKPLRIGELEFFPPIIQGGMDVRISKSGLASAVANAGCVGTIASVGLGEFENVPGKEYVSVNNAALRSEIARTRTLTDRPFAVNIMGVLTNYPEFVKICVEEKVAIIISGAGLPGRVIMNPLVRAVMAGERVPFRCNYQCLKTCDPARSPYCIAKVLADAASGNFEKAFAFAGQNAYRCKEIISVKKLVSLLIEEMNESI